MKKLLSILILSMLIINIFSVSIIYGLEQQNYVLCLDITVKKNLILAKYDIDVYVDNRFVDTIEYGKESQLFLIVTSGLHDVTFTKNKNKTTDGADKVSVTEDCTYSCSLKNHELYIEIEESQTFSGAYGGTNYIDLESLPTEPETTQKEEVTTTEKNTENQTDLEKITELEITIIEEETTIDNNTDDYTNTEIIARSETEIEYDNNSVQNVSMIDPYDELLSISPEIIQQLNINNLISTDKSYDINSSETIKTVQETLNTLGVNCGTPDGIIGQNTQNAIRTVETYLGMESTGTISIGLLNSLGLVFSEDYARRAVVVAFTNYYAYDIFTEDGNTYDESKFHSYSDLAGMHLVEMSPGKWEQFDNYIWCGTDIRLKNTEYDSDFNLNAFVIFDGKNYFVFGLTGSAPSYPDVHELQENLDYALFFIVPARLVAIGREGENISSQINNIVQSTDSNGTFDYSLFLDNPIYVNTGSIDAPSFILTKDGDETAGYYIDDDDFWGHTLYGNVIIMTQTSLSKYGFDGAVICLTIFYTGEKLGNIDYVILETDTDQYIFDVITKSLRLDENTIVASIYFNNETKGFLDYISNNDKFYCTLIGNEQLNYRCNFIVEEYINNICNDYENAGGFKQENLDFATKSFIPYSIGEPDESVYNNTDGILDYLFGDNSK